MPETKVFSLAEANELVTVVSELTADVVRQLDDIRQRYRVDAGQDEPVVPETVLREVEELLRSWSERIGHLGASPKGYFTVDFQSVDPEMLYCWTYGEDKISFTHKVWENFSHRRPLSASLDGPADHLKWVN
jgi:hypothetical protein